MKKILGMISVGLIVLALFFGSLGIKTVKTGELGIVSTMGKVTDTREAGMTWVMPMFQKVTRIKVTQDKYSAQYSVSTSDMQTILVDISVQYSVDPSMAIDLYTKFGGNYVEGILVPSIAEIVNTAVVKYTIEQFVVERVAIGDLMESLASEKLSPYGVNVLAVDITNHDFSDAYEAAVEKKKVAEQETAAKAEEVKQAELDAERNKIMAESYTKENYLREFLTKWNGEMPQVVGDSQVIIDILDGTLAQDIAQ